MKRMASLTGNESPLQSSLGKLEFSPLERVLSANYPIASTLLDLMTVPDLFSLTCTSKSLAATIKRTPLPSIAFIGPIVDPTWELRIDFWGLDFAKRIYSKQDSGSDQIHAPFDEVDRAGTLKYFLYSRTLAKDHAASLTRLSFEGTNVTAPQISDLFHYGLIPHVVELSVVSCMEVHLKELTYGLKNVIENRKAITQLRKIKVFTALMSYTTLITIRVLQVARKY